MKQEQTMKRAVYPGTFDPVTNGHISLITRACSIFDRVVVAIAEDGAKNTLFKAEERLALMRAAVDELPEKAQIEVLTFGGLLADLVKEQNASAIIRGLRAVSDFEYEFQMALMNRKLARDVETVFLMPALSWVYLSSSIVKDVAANRGDIQDLVPTAVHEALKKKYSGK
jgi:pantetheine-phosphate adenylyltransferase